MKKTKLESELIGDDGGGWEEFLFDDSVISEKCLQEVASPEYIELSNRIKNGRTQLKELYGIELENKIDDPEANTNEQLLKEFNNYLYKDQISLAEECAVLGLAITDLPIEMIIEFLSFFVRKDFGFKTIARYSEKIILNLNEKDRMNLIDFLLKLIELNYMEKNDLGVNVASEIVKIINRED